MCMIRLRAWHGVMILGTMSDTCLSGMEFQVILQLKASSRTWWAIKNQHFNSVPSLKTLRVVASLRKRAKCFSKGERIEKQGGVEDPEWTAPTVYVIDPGL